MNSSASWVCVQCGYMNRCEVTQHSNETAYVSTFPPFGCLQGLIKNDDIDSDKSQWELME